MAIGKPAFRQPIRMGKDTGVPATSYLGNATIVQKAGVSAGFSSAVQIGRVPADTEGSTITTDIDRFVLDLFTAQTEVSGSDVSIEIGLSGDSTYFGRAKVSAAGRYTITPSDASAGGLDKWYNVAANTPIYAVMSAAGSGGAIDGTGIISMHYIPR